MRRAAHLLAMLVVGGACVAACAAATTDAPAEGGGAGGSTSDGPDAGDTDAGDAASDAALPDASFDGGDDAGSDASFDAGAPDGGGDAGDAGPNLCGNGVIDPGEQCDGSDFGGKTCESLGLGAGTLVCNSFCSIVAKNCTPKEVCGDFQDNDGDGAIDCVDDECAALPTCTDSCLSPMALSVPGTGFGDTTGRPSVEASSCSPQSGSELVYTFQAPADGTAVIHVTAFWGDFAVSVRSACDDPKTELACANDVGPDDFEPESVGVPVVKGQTYYVLVDGIAPADEGQFEIVVDVPLPESSCTNLADDDFDGYLDCDDPTSCQGSGPCTPGAKPAGQACAAPTECAATGGDPICLAELLGFPGGYCSEFCDVAKQDCGADAVCADLDLSVHGVCLDACAADADCRPGYACVDEGLPKKVCIKGPETLCEDNLDNDGDDLVDCEDPKACQSTPACTPGNKGVGQPCTKANECSANANDPVCLDPTFWGFPSGYCSQYCDLSIDDCGFGGLCVEAGLLSGNGVCLDTCTTNAECQAGYSCLDIGYPQKVCLF